MSKPWSDMTDRERDAALAELVGYSPCGCSNPECDLWAPPSYLDDGASYKPFPAFTSSLDAVRLVEEEIERRGLQRSYLAALHQLTGARQGSVVCDLECLDYEGGLLPHALWAFVCATAAQRAEAAYIILKEAHVTPT